MPDQRWTRAIKYFLGLTVILVLLHNIQKPALRPALPINLPSFDGDRYEGEVGSGGDGLAHLRDDEDDDDEENTQVDEGSESVPSEQIESEQSGNGNTLSSQIADRRIEAVLKQIGSERGPFIVGGIGDSGTRGVWDVLMKLGVYMQGQENVRGDSRDSFKFMMRRPTIRSNGSILYRSPAALYNEPMQRSRSIKYGKEHVRLDYWDCGRQWVADMVSDIMNDTLVKRKNRGKIVRLHPFGFKHPRTALILPYFFATLGSKFAFIHVVRDGREVAVGDNNYLFMDHCAMYYGHKCQPSKAIDMWADLNLEIFEFAMESGMTADQYFVLRIEDLVTGDLRCYQNLIKFLELPENLEFNLTEKLQSAMTNSQAHSRSYFGQKYLYGERLDMLNLPSTRAKEALRFWGYSDSQFKLEMDCTKLPWMEKFRERKGKLLIDDAAADI